MSKRAEEDALKAYPIDMQPIRYPDYIDQFGGKTEIDVNSYLRCLFQEGYELAEKDLGWISVKDKLPDSDGWYFACNEKNHGVICSIGVSYFNGEIWQDQDEDFNLIESNIDYWMPVPKLPNKE